MRQLKRDFPTATFVLNGGIVSLMSARDQLIDADGVMLGRAAYHDPYLLAGVDQALFDDAASQNTREAVVLTMSAYLRRQTERGIAPRHIVRHMLGLFQGLRGARQWRRTLSDAGALERYGADILAYALDELTGGPEQLAAA